MGKSVKKVLAAAAKRGALVSVFTDPEDSSRFSVGYVDALTDKHVRLRAVSRSGEHDGYIVRNLDSIFRVDFDGHYEGKIELFCNNQGEIYKSVKLGKPPKDTDLVYATLVDARKRGLVTVIWFDDPGDSIVGYVDEITDEIVKIRNLGDSGRIEGFSAIVFSEIRDIDCNARSEQRLQFLEAALRKHGD